jgi:hypothetical protein
VFVVEVTDKFILRLGVLQVYNASVDLGCHLLRLGQEEVTDTIETWRPTKMFPALTGRRRSDSGSM